MDVTPTLPEPAPLQRSVFRLDRAAVAALLAIGALLLYFYGFHNAYPNANGNTVARWTWLACNAKNDFLHGRAIPVIFVVMAVLSWRQARGEIWRPSNLGLAGVALGAGLFVLSVRTVQPRLALFGLPFLILGAVLHLFGPKVAKHFIFPAFIWYFAIPIPGIQQATSLLQVVVTKVCYLGGTAMGMPLINDGNTISGAGWTFDIAEGCSGIRSLMALAMIAAIYANYTQKTLWKKVFLFACALPLSLVGNFGRIFTILLLSHFGFEEFAAKTYHDWAGLLIFFPIALAGLFAIDFLLNIRSRGRKKLVRRTVRRDSAGTMPEAAIAAEAPDSP